MTRPVRSGRDHLAALAAPLATLDADAGRVDGWGRHLATVLAGGGRLLTAGNGGSAAQAQHLSAELVGRYRDDRRPFSAIALCAESSTVTAIANDYGLDEVFARQVRGHGRPGDVLVAISTSGRSPNLVAAAVTARQIGVTVWGLTGPGPNPLLAACDDAVVVDAEATATIQEIHQVVVHLLCAAVECALLPPVATASSSSPPPAARQRTRTSTGSPRAKPPPASRRPLVVIGDALLDRDLDGSVERLCPDAPVPVVDDPSEQVRPGGAALAAVLAAGDGAEVTLITALADDAPGRTLRRLLGDAGVAVLDVGLDGSTPEKVRVRAGGHSLVRIDRGGAPGSVGKLLPAARAALDGAAAVLVADYGRGMAASPEVRHALRDLVPHTPVVWDPHPRGPEPVPGVRLVTPNRSEAAALVPLTDHTGAAVAAVAARARELTRRWRVAAVAVTMGASGAVVTGPDGSPLLVPVAAPSDGDPCGAGDRFAAAAAVALGGGALVSEAVEAAVAAASAFVAAGGAAGLSVDLAEPAATAPAGDVAELVARVRANGGALVATGGCFDLLHAGHVHMLRAARSLGDALVVLLNSDESVRRLKGPDRPLQGQDDRAAVLAALDCVDAVVVFDEDTPVEALERLRPDVFAKGADYAVADLPEATTLASWGGETVVVPYLQGRSTTRLLEEAVRRAL